MYKGIVVIVTVLFAGHQLGTRYPTEVLHGALTLTGQIALTMAMTALGFETLWQNSARWVSSPLSWH
ncbi:hypothetical protein [Marinobacter sp.]|uniref:hypothetical protein n=1 Tax=Marinobacter sp. TaxID=50741 RepID=UPI003B5277E6